MKKHMSIIIVFALLLSIFAVPAHAAVPNADEPTGSNYFTYYGASLSRQGGGTLLITFSTSGVGLCDVLGVATFRVECLDESTGHWYSVTGDVSGETGTNVATYNFSRYFYGTSGYTYRVCVTFFCQKGSGSEHKIYNSPAITA